MIYTLCSTCSPQDAVPIASIPTNPLLKVYDDENLFQVLNKFQVGYAHIAGVYHRGGTPTDKVLVLKDGSVTAQDIETLDANKDGTIDRAEIEAALSKSSGGDVLIGVFRANERRQWHSLPI